MLEIKLTIKQDIIPNIVGTAKETKVHLILFVSFFIVKQVVPHGKWKMVKSIVHIAVVTVQPFATNRFFSSNRFSYSINEPVDM